MTHWQMRAGDEVEAQALHACFLAAFADYLIGPFQVPLDQWPAFLARQGVDLSLSRVAVGADGTPLAFAFASPRLALARWRLGTMGAAPAARGTGAAPQLLDDFIGRARVAGCEAVELEVFVQNDRARRLYESRGFEAVHALYGYLAEPGSLSVEALEGGAAVGAGWGKATKLGVAAEAAPEVGARPEGPVEADGDRLLRAVDRAAMLDWLMQAQARIADLPLQVTAPVVALGRDYHAWQRGGGQLVFSLPDETVLVHSLIAPDPGDARALIEAVARVYGQRRLRVPQLQRDDLGGAMLRSLGAQVQPLHQQLMVKRLR